MGDIAASSGKLLKAGLDGVTAISSGVTEVVQQDLKDNAQTQEFKQNVAPGREGSLCGTTGTTCTRGLVCSPVAEPKNTQTATYNNGMCVDYMKPRKFGETCDSTGVLHCDPKYACLDAGKLSLGKKILTALRNLFKGNAPKLRRCTFCRKDQDCIGDRWCGTTKEGQQKECQTGVKPPRTKIVACVSEFTYNNKDYTNTCVTEAPYLYGPDGRQHSWCPTIVGANREYEGGGNAFSNRDKWNDILLCTDQKKLPFSS